MVSVFYIAAIIAILASIKVIISKHSLSALVYFIISLLAISMVFFAIGAYFSAALMLVLCVGGISVIFLLAISLLHLQRDVVEQSGRGISPKIWLGPLILVFVLFVTLIYAIVSTDYASISVTHTEKVSITEMLFGPYILVIELAVLLLLCTLVITYHFLHRLYINNKVTYLISGNNLNRGEKNDSTHV